MLGDSRKFKVALSLNMAARGSRLGPLMARLAYWLWETAWDAFFRMRAVFFGHAARFEVQGLPIIMDTRDRTVTRVIYAFGEYEPFETALLARVLEPGFTFMDIGANTGYYTLLAAGAVGKLGKVVAFEPSPSNGQLLARNVRLNNLSNIVVEQVALASEDGEVDLYLSTINDGDHRIYDGHDDDFYNAGKSRSQIRVRALTLDTYLDGWAGSVDVIKMDVQGAEIDVLRGMRNTLASNESVILMAEYWPHGLARCAGNALDFLTILDRQGFRIFRACAGGETEELRKSDVSASVRGLEALTLFFSRSHLGGQRE